MDGFAQKSMKQVLRPAFVGSEAVSSRARSVARAARSLPARWRRRREPQKSIRAAREPTGLLRPGRNCWRIERASRLAFLIDGQAYFSAFAAAAERARHSIVIAGWDFNSRIRLQPDDDRRPVGGRSADSVTRDGRDEIGTFLNGLAIKRRGLHVYVLDWDFAMIYQLEREFLPVYRLAWSTHRRFHFHLDNCHPLGGAQHQKIVVIDDAIAFVGGFDFGPARWDTPEHLPEDPRRIDPWGRPYPPFHDVQIAVAGPAAAALGELVRERWCRACAERLKPCPSGREVWPAELAADAEDVDVAIARTVPAYNGEKEVREVEALYLDAIAAARRFLYFENQYLTSATIGEALAARLGEPDGPEVVIVQPQYCQGWLEQSTMGVLRARLLERVRAADRFGRLRVYHPDVQGLEDARISVHSKVLVVDDRLARVGSANLNNRSMGLDSECDLAFEDGGAPRLRAAIVGLRNRLLAEHLGSDVESVDRAIAETGSMIAAIERLNRPERGLRPLDYQVPAWLSQLVPDAAIVDPERAVDAAALLAQLVPGEFTLVPSRRWLGPLILAALAATLLAVLPVLW